MTPEGSRWQQTRDALRSFFSPPLIDNGYPLKQLTFQEGVHNEYEDFIAQVIGYFTPIEATRLTQLKLTVLNLYVVVLAPLMVQTEIDLDQLQKNAIFR